VATLDKNFIVKNGITAGSAITGTSFVKTSGTSSEFLKADGSVDTSTYLTTGTASSTYAPLASPTFTGAPAWPNSKVYGFTRTMPTVANNIVELGSITLPHGAGSFEISVVVPSTGFSLTKQYLIPVNYNETAGAWHIVNPITEGGPFVSEDFTLEINVNLAVVSFRIRRTTGTTAGTAYVSLKINGNAPIFTESSGTASVAAPTVYYNGAILTQKDGTVSINGVASSTGLSITAAATPGTFIDYRDNSNVSVGGVGSDGTHFIKQIRNVGGSVNRAVFSDLTSSIIVNAANTNYIGLSVRRFSDSQTSDLQQWTNSSASTVYAKIDKDGNLTANSFIKTGGTSSQYLMADGSTSTSISSIPEIIPLDDISNDFDGANTRFIPNYQGSQVTISNPFRLLLTINGIMQYIDSPDYVWMSGVPRRGFFVDYEGQLQFSEPVPPGSEFDARLMPGDVSTTRTRTYPFKALDILLGG